MCDEDEILIRYHFGDLQGEELAGFERRLREEPGLAERLAKLRECIAAHGAGECGGESADQPPAPAPIPRRLADRTTQAVLTKCNESAEQLPPCVGRKRMCLVETLALGAVAAGLFALVIPGMQMSRETSRRLACEHNLGEVYHSLALYQHENGSRFPKIGPSDNAGRFTVTLADGLYAEREELAKRLTCPSSELAEHIAAGRVQVVIPTKFELQYAPALLRDRLNRLMAGSYAYRIGYFNGEVYTSRPNKSNCRIALLADAPARDCSGAVVSRNHGACGQNVLFEDGHVAFLTGCWAPGCEDHLFLNHAGKIAAGRGPDDIVLAPSEATPGVARARPFGL